MRHENLTFVWFFKILIHAPVTAFRENIHTNKQFDRRTDVRTITVLVIGLRSGQIEIHAA